MDSKRKKLDRFDGKTEEEVQENTLKDYLEPDLDLVFLGINPSLMAAHKGRYYAGPGNHFYKLLHAAELVPRYVSFEEDSNLLQFKIGLTNIVERATRSSADLTTLEIRKGCDIVSQKMKIYKPKIAVFNGKCIYQPFAQKLGKTQFHFGLQSEKIGESAVWVVPSSSARCSNFPRMEDKLHFYQGIKKHLQFLKKEIKDVDLKEFRFETKNVSRNSKIQRNRPMKKMTTSANVSVDTSGDNITAIDSQGFIITEILGTSSEKKSTSFHSDKVHSSQERIPRNIIKQKKSCENNTMSIISQIPANSVHRPKYQKRKCSDLKSQGNGTDFMNLIKQRLVESQNSNHEKNSSEEPNTVKKLNFSRLKGLNTKDIGRVSSAMVDVLKSWLRSRLGVVIDPKDGIFGHHARDGTLLARLLHSYDIISDIQLNEIIPTQDPALARVNLRHLWIWLKYVGVECDEQCMKDISNGKGSAALHLFYKIFLCLEKKDRLHFITLQRTREKFLPISGKFDVTVVPEEKPLKEAGNDPLSGELIWNTSVIEWHKEKFQRHIKDCEKQDDKFKSLQNANGSPTTPETKNPDVFQSNSRVQKKELADIDEFDREHNFSNVNQISNLLKGAGDSDAAQSFMRSLKSRRQQAVAIQNTKSQMQNLLLSELWESMETEQEKKLDKILAMQIIAQSQYEKQMVRKLCDIRNEKIMMAGNRRMVERLMQEAREDEARRLQERWRDEDSWESDELDDECKRLKELHQRLNEKKLNNARQKLNRIGSDIVEDLVNISVNFAEYRMVNDDQVPQKIWNEWKRLFIKNLTILEKLEPQKEFEEGEDECEQMFEKNQDLERTQQEILKGKEFEDYHKMQMLWEEFIPEIDEDFQELLKLGENVLGYIVHKLLQVIYPFPSEPIKFSVLDVPVRAVLLGIPDPSLYAPLQELLDLKKVKLVKLEDGVNYCLKKYKKEMKEFDYVDLQLDHMPTQVVDRKLLLEGSGKLEMRRKSNRNTGMSSSSSLSEKICDNNLDRQTQTPKIIPYEDMHPILTDEAYIGKCVYEFLVLGEPISDDLNSKIIFQYLKSLNNTQGWVIINYPNTYAQMVSLERELTGQTMRDCYGIDENTENVDEMDFAPTRITFSPGNPDPFAFVRQSKLVPDPSIKKKSSSVNTSLTAFIRVMPKTVDNDEKECFVFLPHNGRNIDEFYVEQGVASNIQYSSCNASTLRDVVRLIIGDDFSLKNFENIHEKLDSMEEQGIQNSQDGSLLIAEKLDNPSTNHELPDSSHRKDRENERPRLKPGQVGWSWAILQPNLEIHGGIATAWVEMENRYISELKTILDMKRADFLTVVPYKDFVMKEMRQFVQRPDNKQDLLSEFQKAFNDIPKDMRDDEEVKCELHCRVNDFQAKLWEICDSRRREAEKTNRNIVLDDWTAMKIISLTNIYIKILQAELDRFVDTLQVIDSYYSSIIERPLQDILPYKISLHKLHFGDEELSENISQTARERNKFTTTRVIPIEPPPILDANVFELKTEISNFLLNVNENLIDSTQSMSFKMIQSNINYIQLTIDKLFFSAVKNIQKVDMDPPKNSRGPGDRKRSSKRTSLLSGRLPRVEKIRVSILENQRMENLSAEWQCALNFESNRISLRLKMLEKAVKSDIDFLLSTMKRTFDVIRELIVQRFKNEIQSVNDAMKIFSYAIEEEKSIQEELIFDGDRFIMNSGSLMYPDNLDSSPSLVTEDSELSRFKISQLGRLKDILVRVAPSGNMPALSLVYILQDLIAVGDEERGDFLFPPLWLELEPRDVFRLVQDLFHNSPCIDWREFLIYAMDVEMPNIDELLDVQEAFNRIDSAGTDLICKENFFEVPLWFPVINMSYSLAPWLHDDYEQDEEQMFEDEMALGGFQFVSSSRKPKNVDKIFPISEEMSPEDFRLILIKELLCEMFLTSSYMVNYSAMLLSFCKDEDPKQGLSKALSLAVGKKLCFDFDEGERYISEILEEKKTRAQQTALISETLEVQKFQFPIISTEKKNTYEFQMNGEILNNLMEKVFDICDTSEIKEVDDISEAKNDQPGVVINPTSSVAVGSEKPSDDSSIDSEASKSPNLSHHVDFSSSGIPSELSTTIVPQSRNTTYWLSLDVFKSVLAAVDDQILDQREVINSGKSFSENLDEIRGYLRCEELNSDENVVLAHRLIHHELVVRVVSGISKFSNKNLGTLTSRIIEGQKKRISG